MNEEQSLPDAKKSLCWNCKYGMCLQETQRSHLMHGGMPNFPQEQQENIDGFGMSSFGEEEQEEPGLIEHIIEEEQVRAICFWRPEHIEHAPPVSVAYVDKCNQFKKKD